MKPIIIAAALFLGACGFTPQGDFIREAVKGSLAGPAERRYDTMFEALKHGQTRVEAWNWLGPGRGVHVNMEAQDYLLPEQISTVAAARDVA